MKKTFFNWLIAVFCLSASTIFAADCGVCDPCSTCTCECEPCDFQAPCPPSACAYNAPEFADIKCAWDVFTSASYLYWEAKQDQMEIGQENITYTNGNTDQSLISMDFGYNSAFKVALGVNFNCDFWKLGAEYTWYHHDFKRSSTATEASGDILAVDIIPAFGEILFDPQAVSNMEITGKWKVGFDKLDITLSRRYFVGQCLTVETGYGIRALWISQQLNTDWEGLIDTTPLLSTLLGKQKVTSWAVGPKFGINTNWMFCEGFRVIGNFDIALAYTKYDRSYSATFSNDGTTTVTTDVKNDNPCYLRPQTGLMIGLGWSDYLCCNDWFLDLQLGYEAQVYWNQNMFIRPIQGSNASQNFMIIPGNLYLHGLTFTARVDF